MEEFDLTTTISTLNSSNFENDFKKAQVLQLRNNEEEEIKKYQSVCYSIEKIKKKNPSSNVELHYIPLSLSKIGEIYQKKEDLEKALLFMRTSRCFLEYISQNKPSKIRNSESSDEINTDSFEEHNLDKLFDDMHIAFEKPDAPPKQDPQEIVKLFMEAQKKREEEVAKENMEKLMLAVKERQQKLENSRWERFLEYVNKHPIAIALGSILFLGIFLVLSMSMFNFNDLDPGKDLKRLRDEAAEKAKQRGEIPHNHKHHKHKENLNDVQDEIQKLQELMNKVKLEQEMKDKINKEL